MHEGEPLFGLHLDSMSGRIRKTLTHEHHFSAQISNGLHLERWRRHRHHDHRAAPQSPRRQSHPLRMIAGGSTNHAAGALFGTQMHHLVEGAAKFEGEHRLGVLAL